MGRINMTNKKYGRLTVCSFVGVKQNGNATWHCQCECGKYVDCDGYMLRTGTTKSCGCLRVELSRKLASTNSKFEKYKGNADTLTRQDGVSWASLQIGKKNKSGVIGVSFDKQKEKWTARLMVQGHYVLLKDFTDFDEAVVARKTAEQHFLNDKVI